MMQMPTAKTDGLWRLSQPDVELTLGLGLVCQFGKLAAKLRSQEKAEGPSGGWDRVHRLDLSLVLAAGLHPDLARSLLQRR
mmetsp:Transcript_32112/g.66149  ORF Transcript_32112/g.66149 Transcript_32112/m.66149 type:complete len:81 (+) Transcript_32112:417-659(+)